MVGSLYRGSWVPFVVGLGFVVAFVCRALALFVVPGTLVSLVVSCLEVLELCFFVVVVGDWFLSWFWLWLH